MRKPFLATALFTSLLSPLQADMLQSLSESSHAFAYDIYHKISSPKENLFFSPYSLLTALAMTYAGAENQTKKEMKETLHFPDDTTLHSANAMFRHHIESITKEKKVIIFSANSLWIQNDYVLLDTFIKTEKNYYGAAPFLVDFKANAPQEAIKISRWVEEKTEGKIKDLIPSSSLDAQTRLVLTNAIYFKGDWKFPFKKHKTQKEIFHGVSKQEKVDMMHLKKKFRYSSYDTFKVAEIPYEGNHVSFVVFLPNEKEGISNVEKKLTSNFTLSVFEKLRSSRKPELDLKLPKFKQEASFELSKTLESDMPSAFSDTLADFSGIDGKRGLKISKILHKAFIEVNEEGAQAAAATAVVMTTRSMALPIKPTLFHVNRPFIFMIKENSTGVILFYGKVSDL